MPYYPILVDLTDQPVVVVGGGTIARRKVETLLEFGARVTVVSPEMDPEILNMEQSGKVKMERRAYQTGDLDGAVMVIAATDDRDANALVSNDAKAANVLVNVVDVPDLCGFIVPANVRRGDLTISVSTNGKSPALTKLVKERIGELFGPEYGELTKLMGEMREIVKRQIPTQPERETVLKKILGSEVLYLLSEGRKDEAYALAFNVIAEYLSSCQLKADS